MLLESLRKSHLTLGVILVASWFFVQSGCSKKSDTEGSAEGEKIIQNSGSDTMVNVAQAWAETYAQVEPGVSVEVSGGGSGTGIAALINGTVDIVNSSRKIEPDEKERVTRTLLERSLGRKPTESELAQARQDTAYKPWEFEVGYDALAVYVHKENPLDKITIGQLARIYGEGGDINKWSQLGIQHPNCPSDEIIRVSRQSNSGTYHYFREALLGTTKDFKLGSRDLHGSKDVVELIGRTPCAIGYSGMGYATGEVKLVQVAKTETEPYYSPNLENALNGNYPIARPLYIYSLGEPNEFTKKYIDWIHSEAGQQIVRESGYVPLARSSGMATEQPAEEANP